MTPNTPLSDDELGAMLGRSVQSKVDDVPTITPSFAGVERRARQITNRRRTAAGLAVGALALFGGLGVASLVSDDEDSLENDVVTDPEQIVEDTAPEPEPDPVTEDAEAETTDPAPAAEDVDDAPEPEPIEADDEPEPTTDEPEPVVVLTDWMDPALLGIIDIESDTNIDEFGPLEAPLVGFDENDVVYIASPVGDSRTSQADLWQVDGIRAVHYVDDPAIDGDQNFVFDLGERIVHVNEDKQARVIADASMLVGAEMRLGRPTAYIADLPIIAGGNVEIGDVTMIDLLTGERLTLYAGATNNDSIVVDVMFGGRVTFVEIIGVEGTSVLLGVDDPSTAPTGFGGADTATLSADGSTLYWLNQVAVTASFEPQLELNTADVATGTVETTIVTLPPSQVALFYDASTVGDQILLERSWPGGFENGREVTNYAAPLLIDPLTGAVTELGLEPGAWKPVAN